MNIYKLNNISSLSQDTAITVGMFDGVHVGHQHILQMLKAVAERTGLTPVVVTFDLHPRQVLGKGGDKFYRITTNEERYALLRQYGINDVVEVHFTPEMAALSACDFFEQVLLAKLRVKALVLGYDNVFGSKAHYDFDRLPVMAEEMGVRVLHDSAVRLGDVEVSSTQIRKALTEGDVRLAFQMMRHGYRLCGRVEKGRQVGRKLGFPTANVCLDDAVKILPKEGVYAVRVFCQGMEQPMMGMANMGGQPTFGLERPVFEVNIFDYEADLYGQTLCVEFVDRLREVSRFQDADQLVAQLKADREAAIAVLNRGEE